MREFEDVINEVGGHGRFQRRLLYGVLGPLFFLLPFPCLTDIFALHVPQHWCRHPWAGTDLETRTDVRLLEKWKDCYLPLEDRPDGTKGHSSCQQYRSPELQFIPWRPESDCPANDTNAEVETVPCREWHFVNDEFERTTVSDNAWVCDDTDRITNAFFAGTCGAIIGTLTFNNLSDIIGRRYIFWFTTLVIIIGGTVKVFVSHIFWLFFAVKLIINSCILATFQVPFAIITEISDAAYRSWTVGMTCVLWTLGMSLLPLVAWLSGDWKELTLISVLPMGLLFLGWKLVPESPRYLLTRGRVDEAEAILLNINRVNGKEKEPEDLKSRLEYVSKSMREEKVFGYLSLFTRWGLARKTVCLGISTVASNFIYYNLSINIGNMAGDLFLNFFALAIVEGPANFLAIWLAEKFGRRWSHCGLLLFNCLCLSFNAAFARTPSFSDAVRIVCVIAKFNCTASFVVMYIQSIEVFPTCLRNTGMGFTTLVATCVGISGPHLVALGRTHDARIPYLVMALICLTGGLAASFLPETAGSELPETMEEAAEFGKDHGYFSWVMPHHNRAGAKNKVHPDKEADEEEEEGGSARSQSIEV